MKLPTKYSKITIFLRLKIAFFQYANNKKGYLHFAMKTALLCFKLLV